MNLDLPAATVREIISEVWTVCGHPSPELCIDVRAVLAGEGTPRLSQSEREAIEAAARRIKEAQP